MIKLCQKWAVMVDVNNICGHDCIYCVKHVRHLRKDQLFQIELSTFNDILDSLEGWPNMIGITGGDPLTHPEFPELCRIVKEKLPKEKSMVFTSNKVLHEKYRAMIDDTFGQVFVNYHEEGQKAVCNHQPLLLAVQDMVKEPVVREKLIENCWCNQMWSPIIGRSGAFFCDCALGLDTALDMGGGWSIEPGWWKRDYADQMEKYCGLCGMCLPYPGQKQDDRTEKISAGLHAKFKESGLRNLDGMEVVDRQMSPIEIITNFNTWQPWRNRQDRGYEGAEYVNPC